MEQTQTIRKRDAETFRRRAEVVAELQRMESENWAFEAMTGAELSELEQFIYSAVHAAPYMDADSAEWHQVSRALKALKHEQFKRKSKRNDEIWALEGRRRSVRAAIQALMQAKKAVDALSDFDMTEAIDQPPAELAAVTKLKGFDAGELRRLLNENVEAAAESESCYWHYRNGADAFNLLKSNVGRKYTKCFQSLADAHDKRRKTANANAESIRCEISRREEQETLRERRQAEVIANAPEIIEQMQKEIDGLKSSKGQEDE